MNKVFVVCLTNLGLNKKLLCFCSTAASFLFASCQSNMKPREVEMIRDTTISAANSYSDLFFDSTRFQSYLTRWRKKKFQPWMYPCSRPSKTSWVGFTQRCSLDKSSYRKCNERNQRAICECETFHSGFYWVLYCLGRWRRQVKFPGRCVWPW